MKQTTLPLKKETTLRLWTGFSAVAILFALTLCMFTGDVQAQTQTFNSSGTFTVPAGVTNVTIAAWGAGGGGSNTSKAAGGGGGGAYTKGTISGLTGGNTVAITVGAGGSPGTSGTLSSATFGANTITANGGLSLSNSTSGGTGGAASPVVGIIQASYKGGDGGSGRSSSGGSNNEAGGGGGGSALTTANGSNGSNGGSSTSTATAGGTGTATGGVGAAADGSPGATDGGTPGAGGGGRGEGSSTSGDGGNGQVVITWTCPNYSLTSAASGTALCGSGSSTVTLNSTSLPDGDYVVTYNTSANPSSSGNTATMTFSGSSGSFTTRSLTGSSTITVTSLSSGNSSGTCSNSISTNNTAVVSVNPSPTIYNTSAGITSICSSSSGTNITLSGSQTGVSYQLRNNSGNVNVGSPVAGTGSSILLPTLALTNSTTFNVLATNTTTQCSMQMNNTVTITVSQAAIAIAGGPNEVCQSSSPSAITLSGASIGGSASSGAWTITSGIGTLSSTSSSSTPYTRTFTPQANYFGTVVLTLATNDPSGVCGVETDTRTITVNPLPTLYTLSGAATICSGTSTDMTLSGSEVGVSYQLRNNSGGASVGSPVAGTGGAITLSTGNLSSTITLNVLATNTTTSCNRQMTSTATVTVSNTPIATATNSSQTKCSGDAITTMTMGTSNSISGTTFAWTRDNTVDVTGIAASGTGNISGTLTNNTNAPITVTFTITPTGPSPSLCVGSPITTTVLVNPTPVGSASPQTVCSGIATSVALSSTISGSTFT
ncbi:MAG: hypothetical protein IPP77_00115 [Bacteroidetes bacterium]|nr:hypothetical protein [Bacteroidota bacterium]